MPKLTKVAEEPDGYVRLFAADGEEWGRATPREAFARLGEEEVIGWVPQFSSPETEWII